MAVINKNMTISELLQLDENLAAILMREGMHCITCGSAAGETLQEAGYVHGMDDDAIDDLVERINDFLSVSLG